jgi:hypothetical protein
MQGAYFLLQMFSRNCSKNISNMKNSIKGLVVNKIYIILLFNLLVSCSKGTSPVAGDPHQKKIEENFNLFESNKKFMPVIPESPYFNRIYKCAFQKEGNGCTPEIVPLIGMMRAELDVDFILKNTIVSHAFLAKNFRDYLGSVKNKYLFTLFSSVSGIVITDEIDVSFYYSPTGMIYISAKYLWKSQEEFSELKFIKDKRFSFNEKKKITTELDYVKDNKIAYIQASIKNRTLDMLSPNLTRLLFHELSHANDYYPADQYDSLDKSKSYFELKKDRFESKKLVSQRISYPETQQVYEYAIFYIESELISQESHNFSKQDFLLNFVSNIGIDLYSYVTNREHLAMMMESYFMLFTENFETCSYGYFKESSEKKDELFWFQKNRILQTNILKEARGVIDLMFPSAIGSELNSLNTDFTLETIDINTSENKLPVCKNNQSSIP